MGWMKFVAEQVRDRGRIYMDEPTIDLWVLQHGWDFPVRYMAVQAATGRVTVPAITPRTAWNLLRMSRHLQGQTGMGGIEAARRFLQDALEDLDYPATLPEFIMAGSWGEAKTAPPPTPPRRGGCPKQAPAGGYPG